MAQSRATVANLGPLIQQPELGGWLGIIDAYCAPCLVLVTHVKACTVCGRHSACAKSVEQVFGGLAGPALGINERGLEVETTKALRMCPVSGIPALR